MSTQSSDDVEDTSPLLINASVGHEASSQVLLNEDDPIVVEEERTQPSGTVLSSFYNITNTILGSGMLAMPSALAATGLGFGIVMIGLCAAASAFGLFLLSRIAAQVGRKSSFFTCASITYPHAAVYFDLAIAVKCFGVSISYLVIVGGLIPQIVHGYWPDTPVESIWRNRETWITISMLVITPFCFLRRLDSLKYTSAFSLVAVAYLLFVVVLFFIQPSSYMPPKPQWSELEWFRFDSNTLSHLPIFVFAFTCHQNIFSVHNELKDNSSREIDKVVGWSIGASFMVYQTIGVIGYLTFGKDVSSNIIALYPTSNIVTGAQIAIAFLVLFSYPLQCHPCRNSLDKVLPHPDGVRPSLGTAMSHTRFSLLTMGIMVASYLLAVTVKDLSTVLAFVGATGSTTICYILPGVFYYKLCENQAAPGSQRPLMQKAAVTMVLVGIVVMITSLSQIFFGSGAAGH
ncbi:hypothetical protein HDV03_004170 [Kappamyces sp. JEL0829]|nr:hypothetical protein HDV03_004170 [Kappamyces sp. JEL0829]KAJ3370868.1 hypothetical protein HDU91_005855 [Kappamyces sp. JEL0680]